MSVNDDVENRDENNEETRRDEDAKVLYRNQIVAGVGCALAQMTVGVLYGFANITLPQFITPPPGESLTFSEEKATVFASSIGVGSLIGCLTCSLLVLLIGQRKSMMILLPGQVLLWTVQSQANVYWILILCRVLLGVLDGILITSCLTYMAEICYPSIRGRVMSLAELCIQSGYVLVFIIGSTSLSWRNISLICGISIPVVPFLILAYMPDSPRWLAWKKRDVQAEQSLLFFRGESYNVVAELNSIKNELTNSTKKPKLLDQIKLLKNRSLALVFSVVVICDFMIHFSGSAAVFFYSVLIFQEASQNVNAYLSTIIAACARLAGNITFFFLSDRCSRRSCFLVPHFIGIILIILLGAYFHYQEILVSRFYMMRWAPVVCVLFFTFFFGIASSALICLKAELMPAEFRSFGVAISCTFFYGGLFLVGMTFFHLRNIVGLSGTFWTYSFAGIIVFLLVFTFLPDTKGRPLENINVIKAKTKITVDVQDAD